LFKFNDVTADEPVTDCQVVILNRYHNILYKILLFRFLVVPLQKKMRILKIKPHLTAAELNKVMNSQKSIQDFKDWQVIHSVQVNPGKSALDISKVLCIKPENIYKKVQRYNKLGVSWKTDVKHGGRRERRCIMSLDKERDFLNSMEEDAVDGQIITYQQVKQKLESQLSHTVSDDYIWDMFKRHRWTKKVPRQSHPQADKAAQEEYKKNSRRIWRPNR
jgi:transposase